MMKRVQWKHGTPGTEHGTPVSPYQPPIAGEILPRPLMRRAAIPADAVARLLPRYQKDERKLRKFASFLLDFEANPYAASLEHPVFAWRLSSAFKGSENEPPAWKVLFSFRSKRGQPESREARAIAGERLEDALKKDGAFAAISGQLSEKQAPSRPADAVHMKRTKKWADWADWCKFSAGMAAFVPAFHLLVTEPLFGIRAPPGFGPGTVTLLGLAAGAFMAAASTARHLLSFSMEGARLAIKAKETEGK